MLILSLRPFTKIKISMSIQITLKYLQIHQNYLQFGIPKPDAFSIYDALIEKLVADFRIASKQVTFILDWKATQSQKLFRRMNNGKEGFYLGAQKKLG
jgi:sRNA-binding carbon storage regulator CsrA